MATTQALVEQATAAAPKPGDTIRALIDRQKHEIQRALPTAMDADRFTRLLLTTVRQTPQLLACSHQSLIAACMLSAQTGLEPGPLGHAYLTPRRKKVGDEWQWEVVWIIGYRGYVELGWRSERMQSIDARCVYEADEFEMEYGLDEKLRHRPATGDRGEVTGAYMIARFTNGGRHWGYMDRAAIDRIRDEYGGGGAHGPWVKEYDAMACKTVIRANARWLPLSTDAASAVAADETSPTEISAHMVDEIVDVAEVETLPE